MCRDCLPDATCRPDPGRYCPECGGPASKPEGWKPGGRVCPNGHEFGWAQSLDRAARDRKFRPAGEGV